MKEANENWIEMAVLCNMMVSSEIAELAMSQLSEEYFRDERNRVLFRALKTIAAVQSGLRFEALTNHLERTSLMDSAGGKGYVTCVYLFIPVGDIEGFMRLLISKAA